MFSDTTTTAPAYRIPSDALGELDYEIDKLNKVAKKLGCAPLVVTRLAEITYPIRKHDDLGDWYDAGTGLDYAVVIDGETPRLPGWTFLGTIQREEAGNILRWAPAAQQDQVLRAELIAHYGDSAPRCDHCNTIRNRIDTYLVREDATGDVKSVGSNCIRDFLGHTNPERILRLLEMFGTLLHRLSVGSDDEDGFGYGRERQPHTTTLEYLTHVATVIREDGFVSKAKSLETNKQSTADVALFNMEDCRGRRRHRDGTPTWTDPTEADAALADAVIAWAKELDPQGSDFLHNLKVALSGEFIQARAYGIAAAGVASYQRAQAEALEKAKPSSRPESQWQGEVGKRMVFDHLTVVRVYDYAGDYGAIRFHTFEDAQGNAYSWATGSESLEVGAVVKLKGTIKAHDEYQGRRETKLSRCAVLQ